MKGAQLDVPDVEVRDGVNCVVVRRGADGRERLRSRPQVGSGSDSVLADHARQRRMYEVERKSKLRKRT